MQKAKFKNQGFTLIETIVVIAIIAIILTVVGVSQSKNVKRKQTESIAYTIKQGIELTRDYALTGEVIDGELPVKYQFLFNPNCAQPACKIAIGAIGAPNHKTIPLKEYDPDEMKIESNIPGAAGGGIKFFFTRPHGELINKNDNSIDPLKINVCGDPNCQDSSLKYVIEADLYGVTVK